MLGDDEVPQHVEGVAIRVHGLHGPALLVHLQEPVVIDAHDPGHGAVLAAEPHLLPAATQRPSAPACLAMQPRLAAALLCSGNLAHTLYGKAFPEHFSS